MGRFKDIWNRKQDGDYRAGRSFVRVMIVATFLAFIFLLIKKDNLIRWVQGGFTIAGQNREIRANAKTIEDLDRRIEALSSDRDSLEKFAREKYQFARKGDDVYIIE